MKMYFLDTNILLDFLGNRAPFGRFALKIFDKGRLEEWQLWTSDHAIITAYYILSKEIGEGKSRKKIAGILKYLEVQPVTKSVIQTALVSTFRDLEDGVQHFCALSIPGIEGLVTRNPRDFKNSQIPIYGPDDLGE